MTTSTKNKNSQTAPRTGEALLKRVQALEHLSKEEKAIECSYYTMDKGGNKRISLVRFLNALIKAEGIDLDGGRGPSAGTRGGRSASFRVSVQANGNILIGTVYTQQMNLSSGDEFEITLGRKHIKLVQAEP